MLLVPEYQGEEHDKCNHSERNHRYRNRFSYAAERHLEGTHPKCGGTDEKHGSIANKEEIGAILQEGAPKPGLLFFITCSVHDVADNDRHNACSHKSQ